MNTRFLIILFFFLTFAVQIEAITINNACPLPISVSIKTKEEGAAQKTKDIITIVASGQQITIPFDQPFQYDLTIRITGLQAISLQDQSSSETTLIVSLATNHSATVHIVDTQTDHHYQAQPSRDKTPLAHNHKQYGTFVMRIVEEKTLYNQTDIRKVLGAFLVVPLDHSSCRIIRDQTRYIQHNKHGQQKYITFTVIKGEFPSGFKVSQCHVTESDNW